jgi:superfamily II DNA or RNA helicase
VPREVGGGVKVTVGSFAWMSKADLTVPALQSLKAALTVIPKKQSKFAGDEEDPEPIYLFSENDTHLGVARQYFLQNAKQGHEIVYDLTDGSKATWPGPLVFHPDKKLRPEQGAALQTILSAYHGNQLGGLVQAPCGWGKTAWSCALIHALQVPTLVIVHKEFLMGQWLERIQDFLPGAQVGIAQQQQCDYKGKHIVVGMVHSLAKGTYPKAFYDWPGLVLVDECHRIGARTWSPVPAFFKARFRIGLSATPRRKDGADKVFHYHLGKVLFAAKEQRLKPTIKRVYSKFRLVKTPTFNPNLAPESLVLNFLCANDQRNRRIVELMIDAVKSGRKLLILSKRIAHLNRLEAMFHREWKEGNHGAAVSTGYYVGGMSEEARYQASFARVIFATAQFAAEGLDIPALDTLFLVNPMGDVEQAVGRILRPYEGKKDPIVVDIRDDLVQLFEAYAQNREKLYRRIAS